MLVHAPKLKVACAYYSYSVKVSLYYSARYEYIYKTYYSGEIEYE